MPLYRPHEHRFFKNDYLEQHLTVEGYCVVPFFTPAEIAELHRLFATIKPANSNEHLPASLYSTDKEFKQKVTDTVAGMYQRGVNEWLTDVKIMGGAFLNKLGGRQGMVYPHQDWNCVDETLFRSCNIWVPLVDTNEHNGAICIMPRTHNLFFSYRGPNIENQCQHIQDFFWENSIMLPLKAGEALIYDHRLIHSTDYNFTDTPRLVTACSVMPQAATEQICYQVEVNGQQVVHTYTTSPAHFISDDRFSPPPGVQGTPVHGYSLQPFTPRVYAELNLPYSASGVLGVEAIQTRHKQTALLTPHSYHQFFPKERQTALS